MSSLPQTEAPPQSQRWWRLIPVIFLMYTISFMDRVNVSMVLPFMGKSLHLSESDKGSILGVFFLGYVLLQPAAGYLAARWSPRKMIFILLLWWGAAAIGCGLVHSAAQLEWARFGLGVAEGGVVPAVWLLLRSWFVQGERARAFSYWLLCLPMAAAITAPVTGLLLRHFNWQETFILEGIPPVLWSVVWWFTIQDRPEEVSWLSREELHSLQRQLQEEEKSLAAVSQQGGAGDAATVSSGASLQSFGNLTVWLLVLVYFFWITGFYGINLWLPAVIKARGITDPVKVGFLTAIPYTAAMAAMVGSSHFSDRTGQRVPFITAPLILAALCLLAGGRADLSLPLLMLLLTLAAAAAYIPFGPFWAVPGDILPAAAAGVAVGLINGLGNLGGYIGPKLVAWAGGGHASSAAFYPLAVCLIIGALLSHALRRRS